MPSYLDQNPGFVFIMGIGYLHKSYDEHGLEKNRVHYRDMKCGEGVVPMQRVF